MSHVVFVDSNRAGIGGLVTGKALGHEVTFVRSKEFAHLYAGAEAEAALAAVDRVVDVTSTTDAAEVLAAVTALHGVRPIDALITVWELAVPATARAAAALGLRFPSVGAVDTARHKDRCRRALDAHGVPSPAFAVVDSLDEALCVAERLGYPVIAKPTVGMLSLLAARVDDADALAAFFTRFQAGLRERPGLTAYVADRVLLEAFLHGPLLSVEIGALGDSVIPFMVTMRKIGRENPAIELGSTMPAPIRPDDWDAVLAYATKVLRALGLTDGIFHLELILTPAGPRLVEANPRLMGGSLPILYQLATGRDIFAALIDIHLGRPIVDREIRLRQAASLHCLGASKAGQIRADLPDTWFDEFEPEVVRSYRPVRPGQPVREMIDSATAFGVFLLTGPTPEATMRHADALVTRIGAALGVDLHC